MKIRDLTNIIGDYADRIIIQNVARRVIFDGTICNVPTELRTAKVIYFTCLLAGSVVSCYIPEVNEDFQTIDMI